MPGPFPIRPRRFRRSVTLLIHPLSTLPSPGPLVCFYHNRRFFFLSDLLPSLVRSSIVISSFVSHFPRALVSILPRATSNNPTDIPLEPFAEQIFPRQLLVQPVITRPSTTSTRHLFPYTTTHTRTQRKITHCRPCLSPSLDTTDYLSSSINILYIVYHHHTRPI